MYLLAIILPWFIATAFLLEAIPQDVNLNSQLTPPTDGREKRAVAYVWAKLWPKNETIYYAIEDGFDNVYKQWIRDKVAEIATSTCMNFAESTKGEKIQMIFAHGDHCGCRHGYPGPDQVRTVTLGESCYYSVQHEVFHGLGLGHTQERNDRDDYITVNDPRPNGTDFLQKVNKPSELVLNVSYDHTSVMHYKPTDGSIDGNLTIIPKDPDYIKAMYSHVTPAFTDYKSVNVLYKCGDQCPTKVVCENGGYPHPRKCNECVCPHYYQGTRCQIFMPVVLNDSKPSSVIRQSAGYCDQEYQIWAIWGDYAYYDKIKPTAFQVPPGRRIKVTIEKMTIYGDSFNDYCKKPHCTFAAVEIVDNEPADMTIGGKQFCCKKNEGYSFVSKSNIVGYRAYFAAGVNYDIAVKFEIV